MCSHKNDTNTATGKCSKPKYLLEENSIVLFLLSVAKLASGKKRELLSVMYVLRRLFSQEYSSCIALWILFLHLLVDKLNNFLVLTSSKSLDLTGNRVGYVKDN